MEASELRQDPVSHDWVIIAKGRARKPDDFKKEKRREEHTDEKTCVFCAPTNDPFENPDSSGNKVIFTLPDKSKDWWVKVIENKYPAVEGDKCGEELNHGPYLAQTGAGNHEVVISRDHWRTFGQMSADEIDKIFEAYQLRYKDLKQKDCAKYILIFHNNGREAGASLFHPHSQIIAIPVIPSDVRRSLAGSREHKEKTGECIHCQMITWEIKESSRVVYENDEFVVISPYVPRTAFELRIYPKEHQPNFENINLDQRRALAEALKNATGKLYTGLNDPAYNFFIHTAPSSGEEKHEYYHWHLEIFPKTSTLAGFELATGVEISVIDPDDVANHLNKSPLPRK